MTDRDLTEHVVRLSIALDWYLERESQRSRNQSRHFDDSVAPLRDALLGVKDDYPELYRRLRSELLGG